MLLQTTDITNTNAQEATMLKINDAVDTADKFNSLPIGAILLDSDGWAHTKVRDWDEVSDTTTYVVKDGQTGTFSQCWNYDAVLVALPGGDEAPAPARPTIDFSTSSRQTARDYAAVLNSRILKPESQKILKKVAQGSDSVDAYALNAALTDAMRAVATRFGQSMQRRDVGRKAAHIAHIVQAVLENHADALPVYEDSGVRSRKIEEQAREIAHAGSVNQRLTEDLTKLREERSTLTQAASDERRRLTEEIDGLKEEVQFLKEAATATNEVAAERDVLLAETIVERDTLAVVIAYALERVTAEERERIQGFWDGVNDSVEAGLRG